MLWLSWASMANKLHHASIPLAVDECSTHPPPPRASIGWMLPPVERKEKIIFLGVGLRYQVIIPSGGGGGGSMQSVTIVISSDIIAPPPLSQESMVQIDWQWPLFDVHSIMMVNSAQPGEGGGVHFLALSLYLPSRAKLCCTSWEGRADTLRLFLLYPFLLCAHFPHPQSN